MALREKAWRLLAIGVSLALVATACQGGTTTPPAASQSAAASAAGAADPNGTFTSNLGSEPDTIDPQKESFVGEIAVTMKVFEALMTPDVKTGKPIPSAAKDQPKVSSDGKTYTYTLRDDLTWSDGKKVTTADFKYGWERLCDPATAGDYAFTGYIVAGCEAWNTMDPKGDPAKLSAARDTFLKSIVTTDTTIAFTLTDPAPYFNAIASIWVGVPVRKDLVQQGGDKWTEPATFIGNGPFKMTEWKHNESITFERSDNWHGGKDKAKLKTWKFVMINDNAVAFAAYRNNELDVYGVAPSDLRTITGDADLSKQVQDGPGACSFYIGFNTQKAPFTDVNARVGFAKSFDRDTFIKDVQQGIGKASTSFISPGIPGYDAEDTFQKFDAAAAKASWAKVSSPPEIKFTFSSTPTNKTRAEWLQQQWKTNLGVDVTLDPVDSKTYTQLVKKTDTTPQMFFLGWCADYYDQQDWLSTVFQSTATISHTGWKNADFDKLVQQADKEPDLAKRDQEYKDAQRLLSKEAPVGFLFYNAAKVLKKPWVNNYYITPLGFEQASFTDLYVTKR